jgi:poly-gamma-glutamate system protein
MLKKIFVPKKERLLYGCFILSLLFFLLAKILPFHETRALREEMIAASQIMADALDTLKRCRESRGLGIDSATDVNRTGIVGLRLSPITTTLGNLEAKRTSANPNFAGLLVFLLREAEIDSNDTVAIGASGSFPGLIVAVLSAIDAMDLRPLFLVSIGASQWGANHPDFHWLHMQSCLIQKGVLSSRPLAISMGGDQDSGRDMDQNGRDLLSRDMAQSGYPIVTEENLVNNVESKMQIYLREASGEKIKIFINIGGSWSNLGTDSEILHLQPGLGEISRFPSKEKWGVIYAMAAMDIPVLHLLYIKGLVQRYGLPWDPVPLPEPGQGDLYKSLGENQKTFFWISVIYLLVIVGSLVLGLKNAN